MLEIFTYIYIMTLVLLQYCFDMIEILARVAGISHADGAKIHIKAILQVLWVFERNPNLS